jgi:hypothetical protein
MPAGNMGLPQARLDKLSSASVLCQSFVVALDHFLISFFVLNKIFVPLRASSLGLTQHRIPAIRQYLTSNAKACYHTNA